MLLYIINDYSPDNTFLNEHLPSYCLFVGLVFINACPILQESSDFLLCRGEVEEKIFSPWLQSLELKGLKFVKKQSTYKFDYRCGYWMHLCYCLW
jgi:hypothetical protein